MSVINQQTPLPYPESKGQSKMPKPQIQIIIPLFEEILREGREGEKTDQLT
jgi:hypothetical protein